MGQEKDDKSLITEKTSLMTKKDQWSMPGKMTTKRRNSHGSQSAQEKE